MKLINTAEFAMLELASNLEKNLSLFDSFPCHVYAKDLECKYLGINRRMSDDLAFEGCDKILGLVDFDIPFLSESQAKILRINDQKVLANKKSTTLVEWVKTKNQNSLKLLSCKIPLLSSANNVIGLLGISFFELNSDDPDVNNLLTERQTDCLVFLVKGLTAKQIALELGLSFRTVEHYLQSLKIKFNCKDRAELVQKALTFQYVKEKL